jgi:16S rRNA (uracil1498-N3)-methyltransferase
MRAASSGDDQPSLLMKPNKDRESGAVLEEPAGKIRLFVDAPLAAGAKVTVSDAQSHYLLRVMRARAGDRVLLFNGTDGEWRAIIASVQKNRADLVCEARIAEQHDVPDLWLVFAPIKKTPADYVAQKATELGVRVLQPVLTRRTIARRVNTARLKANAIEAAEQSGRVTVPDIREPKDLRDLIASWPNERRLLFCDEAGDAQPIAAALQSAPRDGDAWAVLTGPEGGFDAEERALLRSCAFVLPVTLGPRIMRADTAALASLALWQAIAGDWRPQLVSPKADQ